MKIRCLLAIAFAACAPLPAAAGPFADALSACLSDSTSGRERKDLARWMFVSMAAHPEMRDLSAANQETKLLVNRSMGRLVTRLISENCAKPARTAVEREGSNAMGQAFESLGRLAVQELMSDPSVGVAISAFEAHMDRSKVQSALVPR